MLLSAPFRGAAGLLLPSPHLQMQDGSTHDLPVKRLRCLLYSYKGNKPQYGAKNLSDNMLLGFLFYLKENHSLNKYIPNATLNVL